MEYKLGKSITKLFKYEEWWVDKSAAEGRCVRLKGDTLEILKKSPKRKKDPQPFGVYTAGSYREMCQLDGERVKIMIPEGVVVYGSVAVKIG